MVAFAVVEIVVVVEIVESFAGNVGGEGRRRPWRWSSSPSEARKEEEDERGE